MSRVPRVPALVGLAAVLVTAGLADRAERPAPPVRAGSVASQPTAAPADSLASTWYCAAGNAAPETGDSSVVIFNPTDAVIPGSIGATGLGGAHGNRALTVPAHDRVSVRLAELARAPYIAAVVQLDRGGAVVEHTLGGPHGETAAPCATTASDRWYFAEGATTRNATLIYSLFNPFPDDAIVDLSFATEEGRSAPAAFQGVVVPANSLVALDVGSHVRRRAHVAAVVRARRGRLVVEAIQHHSGDGRRGVAMTLGATSPADSWTFADGYVAPGLIERLHLYNPGQVEARVAVDLVLDQGEAEPFDLRVPPLSRITLDVGAEPRVPKSIGHALLVRVDNDQPVVAQRTYDSAAPAPWTGYLSDMPSPRPARHWALAVGAADGVDEWVSILNASAGPVRVRVRGGAGGRVEVLAGLDSVVIPRGKRAAFKVAEHASGDTPILVDAAADVFVERVLYRRTSVAASAAVVRSV